jgi:hypothetical protein
LPFRRRPEAAAGSVGHPFTPSMAGTIAAQNDQRQHRECRFAPSKVERLSSRSDEWLAEKSNLDAGILDHGLGCSVRRIITPSKRGLAVTRRTFTNTHILYARHPRTVAADARRHRRRYQ